MGIGFLARLGVDFLVGGHPGRMPALCGLPRTEQGMRSRFVRTNGSFTLAMPAVGTAGHACGKLTHLLLALVFTEAVCTGRRGQVLDKSLGDFMGRLGINNDGGVPPAGYASRWKDALAAPYLTTTRKPINPLAWLAWLPTRLSLVGATSDP